MRTRIRSGELGTILHVESTMTFANALLLKPDAWRASRAETPCGGLTPMGVHAIDGMIDLCGPIDHVFAQSFRRIVPVDADDTTSILFRMKEGMSGYLGTMTATGPGFSFRCSVQKAGSAWKASPTQPALLPRSAARGCSGLANSNPPRGPLRHGRLNGSTSAAFRSKHLHARRRAAPHTSYPPMK